MGELAPIGDYADQRQHADQAADLHARDGLRRRPVPDDPHAASARASRRAKSDSFGYHPHPLLNAPDKVNPGPGRGAVRRPLAAVPRARQAAREEAPADEPEHPPDRVRLPDQPARQGGRHQPRLADEVPATGRLRRLARQARARPVVLPVGRRAGGQPRQRDQALLGLADGPALQQRQAQAGALDVPGAVRDRAQGRRPRACGCGARCAPDADPAIVVQVRPRGAAEFQDAGDGHDRAPTAPGRTG